MNPIATITMANGKKIVIELLPANAPNSVNSFINVAKQGLMDNFAIQRIVPGKWVDVSYTGFRHRASQYLVPYEYELNPDIEPLDSHLGCVCLGGYGPMGESGAEIFFPLKDCPEHKGKFPVIGHVIEGIDEILRISEVEGTEIKVADPYVTGFTPNEPQVIEKVEVETFGETYPEPIKADTDWLPDMWVLETDV
ncbi:MAG: peptidylprolyl isomerase [Mogibacterium sp.]|nr:peptidylprolyl isomerase [Mogibacterium sp.]